MVDPLTAALRAVQLQATVYFHADLAGPWGMNIRSGQFANFHIVTEGRCIVRGGGSAEELAAGDLVVFPTGVAHTLAADERAQAVPAEQMMPALLDAGSYGTGAPTTKLICGHFDLCQDSRHPLFRGLPDRILLRGQGSWVETASELAALESERSGPGSGAIVDRLAEALFIEILRRHAVDVDLGAGALAGLAHPQISKALHTMHDRFAEPWTLDRLARIAGMSRTAFVETFGRVVGEPPTAYLTAWRLATAGRLLAEDAGLEEVAARVGYSNAFSFSKAFKRTYGVAPSEWRRKAG